MKKLLTVLATLVVLNTYAAVPRGEIIFVTANGLSSNFALDVDGTTRLGTGFYGQLYVGVAADNLQKVGSAVQFNTGGAALGFIAASDSTVFWNTPLNGTTMPVGDQAGFYALRAWSGSVGSTFESASATLGAKIGSSTATNVSQFGGITSSEGGSSSFPFANAHLSFQLSTVAVPEPATLALGLFGAAGLLFRRRK